MATNNLLLNPSDGWVQIDFTVLSNIGGHSVEVCVYGEKPPIDLLGHILTRNNQMSSTELPDGTIWFRAPYGRTMLTVSDIDNTVYLTDGNGSYLTDSDGNFLIVG